MLGIRDHRLLPPYYPRWCMVSLGICDLPWGIEINEDEIEGRNCGIEVRFIKQQNLPIYRRKVRAIIVKTHCSKKNCEGLQKPYRGGREVLWDTTTTFTSSTIVYQYLLILLRHLVYMGRFMMILILLLYRPLGGTEMKDNDTYKEELLDYQEDNEKAHDSAGVKVNG
ncbi:hypothetical protein L6452_15320 [Arctium lappa]|uniref:Uncharacterized protein n=1 Tax=Arctium lappa TaxID=4217 RepID=A0ACB9CNG8_ARCLA|nr:hypothetical protein L6452_15320 [Arctium lappa]